jgi:aldehyde dehydrogenase (NAD+)
VEQPISFFIQETKMPGSFSYEWDTPVYKGKTSFNTGLFINGQYVDGTKGKTIE